MKVAVTFIAVIARLPSKRDYSFGLAASHSVAMATSLCKYIVFTMHHECLCFLSAVGYMYKLVAASLY